jgi:ABC-type polysaccharide/polyol phosphate export permease
VNRTDRLPLTFLANTFVPAQNLPRVLRTFADWNPVSAVTQAARELFGNTDPHAAGGAWSLDHPVLYTLIWVGIILAVFVPLCVRRYQRAANR